jgi:hypothetical protein
MFSIGPLEHKNEYGFRQENSPFKKKHLKFPKISLFIFTHMYYVCFKHFEHQSLMLTDLCLVEGGLDGLLDDALASELSFSGLKKQNNQYKVNNYLPFF